MDLAWTVLADGPGTGEVLVVGPSLGTAVETLWGPCADRLAQRYRVVGWDLPGHGRSKPCGEPFTVADLADRVLDGLPAGTTRYAGVSVGGATGLTLALHGAPGVEGVAVLCSGAKIGTAERWRDRAATVRENGTASMVDGSRQRWFAPDTLAESPDVVAALLDGLFDTDAGSYAGVCAALGGYDVRGRLGAIDVPVLAVAGEHDQVCPPWQAREIANGVRSGRSAVVAGAAHLAPAEQPDAVADLLLAWSRD